MEEMKASLAAARQSWNVLKQGRLSEEPQLAQYSGIQSPFADITTRFDRWAKIVESFSTLGKRRRDSVAAEVALCKATLIQMKRCLDQSPNGVAWLCANTPLLSLFNETDNCLAQLRRLTDKDAVSVATAAKEQFVEDVTVVQSAAEDARAFRALATELSGLAGEAKENAEAIESRKSLLEKDADALSEQISAATAKTEADLQSLNETVDTRREELEELVESKKEELTELLSECEVAATSAKKSSEDSVALAAKVQKLLADATAERDAAAKANSQTKTELNEATSRLDQAKQSLNEALKNVRRQGLSGAFFQKAEEMATQRDAEQRVFHSALLYLAVVGALGLILEAYHGLPKDFTEWALRSARTLVLAVPGIWIAWMSARRLSALNRMVSDYEYKSATALAFESYRQEIESSGSRPLMDKLLDNAITTFGENPTRYYDSASDEAAMPAESLLQRLGLRSSTSSAAPKPA